MRIVPLSRAVRDRKAYLYPADDERYAEREATRRRRAREWSAQAWVANTERLTDIDTRAFAGPVSTMVSVASGLNTYLLLSRLGYDANTVIHYVDASVATLAFKRWLLENWDGCDYRGAVLRWFADNPALRPAQPADVEALAGGNDLGVSFPEQWQTWRKLCHHFHELNLLEPDYDLLLPLMDRTSASTAMWWSNAFHSYQTHALLSADENAAVFRTWVETLRRHNPALFVIGTDHYRHRYAGRIADLEIDSRPEIAVNWYVPNDVLSFFAAEQSALRSINRS